MGLLRVVLQHDDAIGGLADLAIVGTAKNVGKTTTFNWLLERLEEQGPLGLTSVGRDGEELDAVTDLPKPRITPPLGSLVATSETSARRSGSRLSLLESTPFRTALGQINVYRVAATGPVEISGPVSAADAAQVRHQLHAGGARRVLVDGAIDRKASASNRVADAVILATGLALLDAGGGRMAGPREVPGKAATQAPDRPRSEDERIDAVVRQSEAILRMLAIPAPSAAEGLDPGVPEPVPSSAGVPPASRASGALDPGALELRPRSAGVPPASRAIASGSRRDAGAPQPFPILTGAIMPDGRFLPWEGATVLEHGDLLVQWLPAGAEALVLAGALTEGVAQALLRGPPKPMQLVVPDGTHVLCSPESFDRLHAQGLSLRATRPIRVLAVTINPTSPHVPGVDPLRLLEAMRRALPLPVFDLVALP